MHHTGMCGWCVNRFVASPVTATPFLRTCISDVFFVWPQGVYFFLVDGRTWLRCPCLLEHVIAELLIGRKTKQPAEANLRAVF
jgi:hypothetical protein